LWCCQPSWATRYFLIEYSRARLQRWHTTDELIPLSC
jgi:hypothetical protein